MEARAAVPKLPGQTAIELLREHKRTEGTVGHFPDDKRREIVKEILTLAGDAQSLGNDNPALATMKHVGALRNKQCFLAYLQARLRMVEQIRWEVGMIPSEIKEKLSKEEINYFEQYNGIVAAYSDNLGLDLRQFYSHPPIISKAHSTTLVEVRVLKDVGEFVCEDTTTILLTKEKRLFMDIRDAEDLIRKGIVEHVV